MHIILCIFFISHQITFLAILFLSLVCSSILFYSILFSVYAKVFVAWILCFFFSCVVIVLLVVRSSWRVWENAGRSDIYSTALHGTAQHKWTNYIHFIFYFCTQPYSPVCAEIFFYFFFHIFFFFQSCIFSLCLSFAFCVSFFCFLCIGLCQSHNNMHVAAEMRTAWTCIRLSKCTER